MQLFCTFDFGTNLLATVKFAKKGFLFCLFSLFRPGKPTKKLLVKCWRNKQENEFESLLQGVEEKRGEEVAVVVVDVVDVVDVVAAVVKLLLLF